MAVTACARIHLLAGRWTSTRGQVHGGTHATLSLYPFGLSTPTFPRLHALRGSRTPLPSLGNRTERSWASLHVLYMNKVGPCRTSTVSRLHSAALGGGEMRTKSWHAVKWSDRLRAVPVRNSARVFWSKTSTLIIDCNASTPQSPFLCIPHHIDREK